MGSAVDVLWERRDAPAWTSYGHEASQLWANVGDRLPEVRKFRDLVGDLALDAERLLAQVRAESGDKRRNEVARGVLRAIRDVAPDVAATGTAMAYWQLATHGTDKPRDGWECRTHEEFKRIVAKWGKAIARARREARPRKRGRIS
jgi:hypothetical protein